MKSSFLSYKSSTIHYLHSAEKNRVLFCFHGYGEDGASFHFLKKYVEEETAVYAIDLPFHGKTVWNEGLDFSVTDLQLIVKKILQQHNYSPQTTKPAISLLGYSLGGRVALSLFEIMPERIDKLILLSPDGLKINAWYWLSTQTYLGNRFFKLTMEKPGWFFGFLKLLNKLNLVNASIFKFVNYYIGDAEVRRLLYSRWTTLRRIKPKIPMIKKNILKYKIPVRLIYGKHDRIILFSVGEKFRNGIEEYCRLSIINAGHQVLHEKHAKEIAEALLS